MNLFHIDDLDMDLIFIDFKHIVRCQKSKKNDLFAVFPAGYNKTD